MGIIHDGCEIGFLNLHSKLQDMRVTKSSFSSIFFVFYYERLCIIYAELDEKKAKRSII